MKKVSLSGSLRGNVGKKDAKSNRRNGLVPCVMYGGEKQVHFTVNAVKLSKVIWTPEVNLIELDIDGSAYQAVIQDIQFHPVADTVLHVDFLQVIDGKPFNAVLPVKAIGKSPGVAKGGRLIVFRRKLKVRGLLQDMPEKIEIDISTLNIGEGIKVAQMEKEGLTFLDPKSEVVIAVKTARKAAVVGEDEDEEEGEEGAEGEASSEESAE